MARLWGDAGSNSSPGALYLGEGEISLKTEPLTASYRPNASLIDKLSLK
jgi:hypothetical protein